VDTTARRERPSMSCSQIGIEASPAALQRRLTLCPG
jgi:hypothetical protein